MPQRPKLVEDKLREKMYNMLIAAGTTGVTQTTFVLALRGYGNAELIKYELEVLLAEDKVQMFRVQGRGMPSIVWRATENILPKKVKPSR